MLPRIIQYLFQKDKSEFKSVISVPLTLFAYMEKYIGSLQSHHQYRTAETYRSALRSFRSFRSGQDVLLEEVSSDLLLEYESYLRERNLCLNTISFYMKRLRSVYNKAVEEKGIMDVHPFRKVFTSSEKTVKRAVPLKIIKRIKELDLRDAPSLCRARDLFLLSFYLRGMSFVDMAYLQKSNLKDGILTYRRKKTGQLLIMRWEPCMERIASSYWASPASPYLLNIIWNVDGDVRKQYHNVQTSVNRHLKKIGRMIGLSRPLTMYVARHSWASIARERGIPLSVISEGMGHDSESTTRIYLASLDTELIDNANRKILGLL